jgi:hypothetical protein
LLAVERDAAERVKQNVPILVVVEQRFCRHDDLLLPAALHLLVHVLE